MKDSYSKKKINGKFYSTIKKEKLIKQWETILVGKKEKEIWEPGYVYAPYIPVTTTPLMSEPFDTFSDNYDFDYPAEPEIWAIMKGKKIDVNLKTMFG